MGSVCVKRGETSLYSGVNIRVNSTYTLTPPGFRALLRFESDTTISTALWQHMFSL